MKDCKITAKAMSFNEWGRLPSAVKKSMLNDYHVICFNEHHATFYLFSRSEVTKEAIGEISPLCEMVDALYEEGYF